MVDNLKSRPVPSGAQALVFGADSEVRKAKRVATVQTVGGSGALKVGADFLKRYFPASEVWISDPSWENHRVVFEGAGRRERGQAFIENGSAMKLQAILREVAEGHAAGRLHRTVVQ